MIQFFLEFLFFNTYFQRIESANSIKKELKKVLYILGLLEDRDIDWLVGAGQKKSFGVGDVLIQEKQKNEDVFLLVEGLVQVSARGKDIATIGPGEIMGEISLLDARTASATLTAVQNTSALAISFHKLQEKLSRDIGFAARLYQALGIFLAVRLRSVNIQLTAGLDATLDMSEEEDEAEEIDPDLIEKISLAGNRFKWIMDKLNVV